MKKTLSLAIALLMILSAFTALGIGSSADFISTDDLYTYVLYTYNGKTVAVITDYRGSAANLTIPKTIDGYPLAGIYDETFWGDKFLVTVTIPYGVVAIGTRAFCSCSNLTSITIPSSVTEIGASAFSSCESLASISLPNSITSIGENAFSYCYSLKSIKIPNKITEIKNKTFKHCSSLSSVTLPNGIITIGTEAFKGCSFSKISLPESITSINSRAFLECEELTNVTIPSKIKTIETSVFNGCSSLKKVTIPYGVKNIKGSAFLDCPSLKSLIIPSSVTSISSFAAFDKDNITLIVVKDSTAYKYAYDNTIHMKLNTYVCEKNVDCPTQRFTDLPEATNWMHAGVDYVVEKGYFNGVTAFTFAPNAAMNRAMLVTVLYRLAGSPAVSGNNKFSDVKSGEYYYNAVLWASNNGIVDGVGNGKFAHTNSVTREQLATILYRYCAKKGIDTTTKAELTKFPDASKVSSWARDALSWANGVSLITGTNVGGVAYLDPTGKATRAQVATILMRFDNMNR